MVGSGAYADCVFYRGEPGFVLQGGLRRSDGTQVDVRIPKPPLEFSLLNTRGTVTMARWEDPNSGAGEFFVNLADSPHLDRDSTAISGWALGFCVFGVVTSGMEVAESIAAQPSTVQAGLRMLNLPVVFDAVIAHTS